MYQNKCKNNSFDINEINRQTYETFGYLFSDVNNNTQTQNTETNQDTSSNEKEKELNKQDNSQPTYQKP